MMDLARLPERLVELVEPGGPVIAHLMRRSALGPAGRRGSSTRLASGGTP